MSSEAIANTVATSTDDAEELEMVSDSHDEGNKDTWQKNEREVELEEQKILIPEKTDTEDSSENAECGVELNKQLSEKIEETEKKDESTSQDTRETSVSIEKVRMFQSNALNIFYILNLCITELDSDFLKKKISNAKICN